MGIIVQKFGGTSVADAACIRKAAAKVIRAREQGHQVVVAVSARAGMTDELIALAHQVVPEPDPRELDMLVSTGEQMSIALMCMALHAMGYAAISLTGGQVGIFTDSAHTKARIQKVETSTITRELDRGKIVVVAGFQGIDPESNITTLGRGASDLTAVALAAALKADVCEIYTDVDGVYTADPRVVPNAAKLGAISHDEILELASMGAKVMQSRSVEVAKKFRVPVCVRSTFSDEPGTVICSQVAGDSEVTVCGAAMSVGRSRITISGLPDRTGVASKVVGSVGARGVNIELLVQSFPYEGKADISFIVKDTELAETLDACQRMKREFDGADVVCEGEIALVSAVGRGMARCPGVAAKMCSALGEQGINVRMISTSEIYIAIVVDRPDAERALRTIHEAFGLDHLPELRPVKEGPAESTDGLYVAMEGLHVEGVECDDDQAELKIRGLADQPGQAAPVFGKLAKAGINLDVVLQNTCSSGISVTMRRDDVERARAVVETMCPPIAGFPPQVSPDIAKVTLSGVGLRSQAGSASKVFGVLDAEGINIRMIGSSEAKLSVVVSRAEGARAVAALQRAFDTNG